MHNEVLRAFNDSCLMAARQPYRGRGFRPAADAYFEEDTREIVVRFELTGLAMDDIELLVDRRELPPGPWPWTDDTVMATVVVERLAHDR